MPSSSLPWTALIAIVLCGLAHTSVVAQAEKPKPKEKPPAAASLGSSVPDCSRFQDWSYGQQCRRNDGKTCQVMGQRADPSELKFCK
jgi:hypothetical protein